MKKKWIIITGTAIVLLTACIVCFCVLSFISIVDNQKVEAPACPPLPKNFTESDLVGTWVGEYFGSIDKLIIRADGTYKQIYSSDTSINFESDWLKWWPEYDNLGYLRLHLAGMRRCDGLKSECNNPGGGLPDGDSVINPCNSGPLSFNHEVILLVTGTTSNDPRGIMLQQARLSGSDWTYTFRLEK